MVVRLCLLRETSQPSIIMFWKLSRNFTFFERLGGSVPGLLPLLARTLQAVIRLRVISGCGGGLLFRKLPLHTVRNIKGRACVHEFHLPQRQNGAPCSVPFNMYADFSFPFSRFEALDRERTGDMAVGESSTGGREGVGPLRWQMYVQISPVSTTSAAAECLFLALLVRTRLREFRSN